MAGLSDQSHPLAISTSEAAGTLAYFRKKRTQAVVLLVRRTDVFRVFWYYMSIYIGASERVHPISVLLRKAEKQCAVAQWLYRIFAD